MSSYRALWSVTIQFILQTSSSQSVLRGPLEGPHDPSGIFQGPNLYTVTWIAFPTLILPGAYGGAFHCLLRRSAWLSELASSKEGWEMIQDHARAKDPLQVPDRPLYFTQQSKENSFSDSTLQLIFKKMPFVGISLVVQQLRLPTSTAQGTGLMPGQGTKGASSGAQ